MRLKTRIFSFCLTFILAVGVILPALSVTSYAEIQYTWEIPLKLTVKDGGSASASAHNFEMELHELDGSKINLADYGGEFLQTSPYVETSGIGEYTATLSFRGGEELRLHLQDGFMVILKDSDEDGWVYDEREYEVNAWFDGAGIMAEMSIIDCDSGDSKDAAAFECTYTGWNLLFETNGGSAIGAVSAANGSTIFLSDYTPTRDNYTFTGWYSDSALQTKVTSVTLDQNKTVYAGWEEITYTWEIPVEITVEQGGSLSVPGKTFTLEAVVDGETIGGAGGSYDITLDSDSITATGAGTYVEALTFSGDYTAALAVSEGLSLSLTDDSEAGWSIDDTEYTVRVEFDWGTGDMTGIEFTAAGETKGSMDAVAFTCTYTGWTLEFETNGGSTIDSVSAAEGTVVDLSSYTPTRNGYTFTDWYEESTLETLITEITLNTDRTVYAGWNPITDTEIIIEEPTNLSDTEIIIEELTAVPEGLKNLYSSVDALVSDLIKRVIAVGTGYTEDNALVYDVVLQYSTDGGKTWITATVDNFPTTGITVTIPYPEGTDSSYEFVVEHMFTVTSERLGITAGDTERPTVTKTDDGLVVTLMGLSPVAVSWKAVTTSTTETDTSSQTDTTAESTDTSGTSASSTTSAQTGDNSPVTLWFVLLSVSGAGVVGAAAYSRKRKYNR